MENVEIYNVSCQSGANNNDIVVRAYQMTDSSVLRSIFGAPSGHEISAGESSSTATVNADLPFNMPKKRHTFFYMCRDLIWKIGRWRSNAIAKFLDEIKPDILYLPVYHSGYMIDVQRYVIKRTKVPVVVHITDELYAYPPHPWSTPMKSLYHMWLRGKLQRLIKKAKYGEAFAEDMVQEYQQAFSIPFYLIGKGVDISALQANRDWSVSKVFSFVFTGNYGGERGQALIALAQAIAAQPSPARLCIYSTSRADAETDRKLAETGVVDLAGAVGASEIGHIQRTADCLVHVEGFSSKSIYETRLSFSTKIIDYLMAMRPILAIGPAEINSIKVLEQNELAEVAKSDEEIPQAVISVMRAKFNPAPAIQYLNKYRNINTIQSGIKQRLEQAICNHS